MHPNYNIVMILVCQNQLVKPCNALIKLQFDILILHCIKSYIHYNNNVHLTLINLEMLQLVFYLMHNSTTLMPGPSTRLLKGAEETYRKITANEICRFTI